MRKKLSDLSNEDGVAMRADNSVVNGVEQFRSRGIGKDWTPGCFVCGGKDGLYSNISGFVTTKESGESVVKMFDKGARLDYRNFEPNWIQVKIGACDDHEKNLKRLDELTAKAGLTITKEIVDQAIALRQQQ